ncbi:hypothetical protein [Devosia sp. RR2S18]|uniref:hypothetical protein n=1 Tax=Devosia rhizosphaerae TaxID=3049774 RepID=UPI00254228E6|nr:hypothetical protein [Devosia sp. RR2S18]WIJ26606.1 hypothetical protein QOV41_07600 [Devosia sp. RR2S18]
MPMYQKDLDIGQPDGHSTMHMAVHHLQLAAAMFDRFPPEMYLSVLHVHAADIPQSVKGMLAAVTAQMELELWLRDWKVNALEEMKAFADDDPAMDSIRDRYAEKAREHLARSGMSEEQIASELGDLAAVLRELREASA